MRAGLALCPHSGRVPREHASRVAALVVVVDRRLGALLAPLVAPQDPYDLAKLVLMDARRPPGYRRLRRLHALARHRRAGPRPVLGHPLRPAHLAPDGRARGRHRASPSARRRRRLPRPISAGASRAFIMRIIDLQLSFPAILLALVLSRHARPGHDPADRGAGRRRNTPTSPAPPMARPRPSAARTMSRPRSRRRCRRARVVFRHILPNCLPPLIVVATVQVANSIALEATLSFLGARACRVDRALARAC